MVPTTIGQYLVRNKFIDEEQLKMALHKHGQKRGALPWTSHSYGVPR